MQATELSTRAPARAPTSRDRPHRLAHIRLPTFLRGHFWRRRQHNATVEAVQPEGLQAGGDRDTETGPTDTMVSYAHKDMAAMRRLRAALVAAGHTVWVDEGRLPAGSQFLSRIGEAILDSTAVIFLLSKHSARSRYCRDEVGPLTPPSSAPSNPAFLSSQVYLFQFIVVYPRVACFL